MLKRKNMVYWTLDYFKIIYDQYTTSGVSVRAFCREQGINENRFYYWIKTLKRNTVSALHAPKEFIPMTRQAVHCLTGGAIEPGREQQLSVKRQDIKITYPSGVVLQLESGCDIETLKQLITIIL